MPISVIITDDHTLFAEGLEKILTDDGSFSVLAIAKNGVELLRLLNSKRPDMLIIDLNMPEMDGIETIKRISKQFPSIDLIVISMYESNSIIQQLKSMNISGFLPKTLASYELIDNIKRVYEGKETFIISSGLKQQNSKEFSDGFLHKHKLTARELQIIDLIKKGNSSKLISQQLFLSELTIETHRKNILKKLNLKNVAGLIQFAIENGL